MTFVANICSVKMKINATSFVIPHNFKMTHANNYSVNLKCFRGTELQKQIPEKLLPQTIYFFKVTHVAIDVLLNMVYLKDQY